MISFFSKASYTASDYSTYESSDGWNLLLPGACSVNPFAEMCTRRFRAPSDFIQTSKEVFFGGDRSCIHRQIDARFRSPVQYLGGIPGVRPASFDDFKLTLRSVFAAQWVVPANGMFFEGSEVSGGAKVFATQPSGQFMTGSPSYSRYLYIPGTTMEYDVAYTMDGYYTTRYRFVFSSSYVDGCVLSMCERFSLSKTADSSEWQSGRHKAWLLCRTWSDTYRRNTDAGLGAGVFEPFGGIVPSQCYPGGIRPSLEQVKTLFESHARDHYGFKAQLAGLLPVGSLAHAGSRLTVRYGDGPSEQELRKVTDLLKNVPGYASLLYGEGVTETEWGEMANTCIDGCRSIDINGIAYIKEGIEYVLGLISVAKTGRIPDMSSPSSLWLSSRYGLTLTARDTTSIVDAAKRAANQVSRDYSVSRAMKNDSAASHVGAIMSVQRSLRYKIYYNRKQDPVLDVLRTIASWDLWPSTKNIWDLIPFSFVVDWFVDVQGQLEHIDNAQYQQFLSILSVLYTEKWTYEFNPLYFGSDKWVCDEIRMTYYHRRHSSSPHYAPLRFGGGHASNINWVDGAMLVLQKMGR